MRVLLCFPQADGQTGPAIKYAFEKLGHEVQVVDAKLDWANSFKKAEEFRPDLVFCSRTHALTGEVEKIKQKFPSTIIATWNVDTRSSIQEWDFLFPLIRLCDYYFVVASNLIPDWQKINPNTFWLPQGLQDEIYHKPDGINKSDILKYECDVSFAGSCTGYHTWRQPYLQAIEKMGVKFKKWGCDGHPQVYNEEHNKMVALSKINFTYSGWSENGKYVSVRNFKILGAGGFLLEFTQLGLFKVHPIRTIGAYSSIGHLKDAINYWLCNEGERKAVAKKGCQYVHANATYTHRVRRALEIMKLGEKK
jgi:hypothetical protein